MHGGAIRPRTWGRLTWETKNGVQREYQWHSPSTSWSPSWIGRPNTDRQFRQQRPHNAGLSRPKRSDRSGRKPRIIFAFDRLLCGVVKCRNCSSRRSVCLTAGQHDQRQCGRQESLTGVLCRPMRPQRRNSDHACDMAGVSHPSR
jgi:hypothetical protein